MKVQRTTSEKKITILKNKMKIKANSYKFANAHKQVGESMMKLLSWILFIIKK